MGRIKCIFWIDQRIFGLSMFKPSRCFVAFSEKLSIFWDTNSLLLGKVHPSRQYLNLCFTPILESFFTTLVWQTLLHFPRPKGDWKNDHGRKGRRNGCLLLHPNKTNMEPEQWTPLKAWKRTIPFWKSSCSGSICEKKHRGGLYWPPNLPPNSCTFGQLKSDSSSRPGRVLLASVVKPSLHCPES